MPRWLSVVAALGLAALLGAAGPMVNTFSLSVGPTFVGSTSRASGTIASGTTHTLSAVTTPTDANLAVIVIQYRAAAAARTCSPPTYNGDTATEILDAQDAGSRAGICVSWLLNPDASGDVVCTVSASVTSGVFCAILFYKGANASDPIGLAATEAFTTATTVTDTGTAERAPTEVLHGISFYNDDAADAANFTFQDYFEVVDVADQATDGGRFGIARGHPSSTALSSKVTTVDDAASISALVEILP